MSARPNRRAFLKRAALGTAGLTILPNGRSAFGYQANEKLDIACVGVGGQGAGNARLMAKENIVALCDVDERRAGESHKRFPKAKRFADFRKMFDRIDKEIDAVVVCTPDHTHAVICAAAMNRGKHVYCEKPLTRTVHEARVLREIAKKQKVVTQMGNQGSAKEGLRRGVELAQSRSVVGEVKEAHVWFGGADGPMDLPKDRPPVPEGLDWDLWLGPAPNRPYHPCYAPTRWRGWRAFGNGQIGDFGCHTANLAFRALRLEVLWNPHPLFKVAAGAVIRVQAEASEIHPERYPSSMKVRYELPARGKLPPATLTWYNGGPKPPEDLMRGHEMTGSGCLVCGSEASVFSDNPWNNTFVMLPQKKFEGFKGPSKTLPRSPGHHTEWRLACKGDGKPFSRFEIGGSLTELLLLSNVALLAGKPIEYDPIAGKVVNDADANQLLHREYRPGWTLS